MGKRFHRIGPRLPYSDSQYRDQPHLREDEMRYFFLPFALACVSEADKPIEPENETPAQPTDSAEPSPSIGSDSLGEGDILPADEAPYRNRKRMSVSQIKVSMTQISGGIEWNVQGVDMWAQYAPTLGVPDYLQRMREEREPGIMFQKFLNDAAVYTCRTWVEQEESTEQRLFFSEIEPGEGDLQQIRLNIIALRQRIHGASRDASHPMIDSLQQVYNLIIQRGGAPAEAWTTVCVGLFTHPDFFTY